LGKRSGKPKGPGKSSGGAISSSPMDLGLLKQIVDLMKANDLTAIELRDGERRVSLRRGAETNIGPMSGMHSASPMGAGGPIAASAGTVSAGGNGDEAGLHAIKSPMVGTFYAAATPDAKPMVAVGSTVDEETDVCIIEAMKVFNNIKAECRGTITKVLVGNGQTVEFGQTLFLVRQ
jgi:acetyl-CoA carboxylase biotin carboxyl carrier protein